MQAPSEAALKALFGLSGNRCAFPDCNEKMVDAEGRVKGIACHIKGDKPTSPRYDREQSDRERHGFHNLIAMCLVHHKNEIDGPEWQAKGYTVEWLLARKHEHEKSMGGLELDPARIHIEVAGDVVVSQDQKGGITAGTVHIYPQAEAKPLPNLSEDSLQVLYRAANPKTDRDLPERGKIRVGSSGETLCFAIGSIQYFFFNDHSNQSRMNACLEELSARKLIESQPAGRKGSLWGLTYAGYELAKPLLRDRSDLWWFKLSTSSSGDKLT